MKGNSRKEKTFIVIGSLFILIGILCNEWVLAALFSSDGVIESLSKRIIIWIFDITLISLGLVVIKKRRDLFIPTKRDLLLFSLVSIICLTLLEISSRAYLRYFMDKEKFLIYASLKQIRNKYGDSEVSDKSSSLQKYTPHRYIGYILTPNYKYGKNKHNSLGYRLEFG